MTDSDGPANAAPFTFDIRAGNVDNAFRVDQDGSLRTAKRFNHKVHAPFLSFRSFSFIGREKKGTDDDRRPQVQDSYALQVRVFDNGSPPLFSDTWVAVRVIEESKYPPIITPLEVGSVDNEIEK